MSFAIAALLPVFLTIALGFGLKVSGLITDEQWRALDHIAYYVLFPAIISRAIIVADYSGVPFVRMALAMILAIVTMAALLTVSRGFLQKALAVEPASFTSVFQGSMRWHTFIGLAIVPALYGAPGLALIAVVAAAIIPVLNVLCVWALSAWAGSGTPPSLSNIVRELARNPFILSCAAGLAVKASGVHLPQAVIDTLDLVGRAALGCALMSVGAGLVLRHALGSARPVVATAALKLMLLPALVWGWTTLFGVSGLPQTVAIVAGSVPTASGAYILARKMGGDAPLMASILTAQVIIAAFTMPVVITLASLVPK